jgi:GH35 family endo-1,4-beta-xylanase
MKPTHFHSKSIISISVRGHSIFWALAGRQHQPKWLPGLAKPEFRDAMETRLDSIVSRYKSK